MVVDITCIGKGEFKIKVYKMKHRDKQYMKSAGKNVTKNNTINFNT